MDSPISSAQIRFCFRCAAQIKLGHSGDPRRRKELQEEMKALNNDIRENKKEIGGEIYRKINVRHVGKMHVDLHGQTVESAINELEKKMKLVSLIGNPFDVYIITGQGRHRCALPLGALV